MCYLSHPFAILRENCHDHPTYCATVQASGFLYCTAKHPFNEMMTMQRPINKGFNGWSQLAILLGLTGVGIILGGIVSIPVWKLMTGGDLMNMEKDMLKPENAGAIQMLQIIAAVTMFLIPTLAYAFICFKNGMAFLGFRQPNKLLSFGIILLLGVAWLPLISSLEELNRMIPISNELRASSDKMEKAYNEQVMAMLRVNGIGEYLMSLFVIAVMPAISEELIFRGGLQNLLTRWLRSPWISIAITSILFSAIHFSWYGFLSRAVLGALLGIIFHGTGNILLNMLAHFLNNAIVVTGLFLMNRSGKPLDMSSIGGELPLWLGAVSLPVVLLLIRWLIRSAPPKPSDDITPDMGLPYEAPHSIH